MNATAEKLRTELATLSDAERAELARFLIQSLDEGADSGAGERLGRGVGTTRQGDQERARHR